MITDDQLRNASIVPKDLGNLVNSVNKMNENNLLPLEVSEVLRAIGLIGVDEAKKRNLHYGGWVPQEILFQKFGPDKYMVHFLDRDTSLIFKNPKGAYDSIIATSWNIINDADKVEEVAENNGILHINYNKMPFNEVSNSYNTVLLDPHKPYPGRTLKGKIQRNYYGKNEEMFKNNMDTLIKINDVIRTIYIPSKDDMVTAFNKNPDAKAISKACWLGIFYFDSVVDADGRSVNNSGGLVFGVPSKERSDDAKKFSDMEKEIYSKIIEVKIGKDHIEETKQLLHNIVIKYQKP